MVRFVLLSLALSLAPALSSPLSSRETNAYILGTPGVNATYDYVVVGGGTAGLALAARLVQGARVSVAVIEAGGVYQVEQGNGSWIPALAYSQGTATDLNVPTVGIDWGFASTAQEGLNGRRLRYARGRCLGGSSARNYMIYHRANRGAYQKWATTVGDDSYSWGRFETYLKKSVEIAAPRYSKRQTNSSLSYDAAAFSLTGGPLHVSWPNWGSPFGTWFVKGLEALGLRENAELNSGSIIGTAWTPYTVTPDSQQRDSSSTSFLGSVMQVQNKGNLTVYTKTLARRILFSPEKVATGVLVSDWSNGKVGEGFILSAKREVILSAGALQSPQLLMVSGIGLNSTLSTYEIPLVAERPGVGQNLQDHALVGISFPVNVVTSSRLETDRAYLREATDEYYSRQTGLLTYAGGPIAFEKLPSNGSTTYSNSSDAHPADWPDLEYIAAEGFLGPDPNNGVHYGSIVTALAAPISRGNVTIASPNTFVPPIFDLGLLKKQEDAITLLAGFKRSRKLLAALSDVALGPEVAPGPAVTSDAEILAYIRQTAGPVWHASGTCAMGKKDDPNAVVDSKARVYGVTNLRVVDASTFPFLLPGHPQATVYALAEKIADDILSVLYL